MKQLSTLLAVIGIVIVSGCKDKGNEPAMQLRYNVTIEDHETSPYQFPSGVYYSFAFPEPQSFKFDVDAVFRQALVIGVRLRDAWYKNYGTECAPPGGIITLPATVPGALVVRVDEPTTELQTIGFVRTSNPDVGWCAYRVHHYHFEQ